MADFSTHVLSAAAVGTVGAVYAMKQFALPEEIALLVLGSTTIGGILPDIDLRASRASRTLFSALGLLAAMFWVLQNVADYSLLVLFAVGGLLFALIRFPLAWLLDRFTVHRGALHSIVAGLFFMLAQAVLLSRQAGLEALYAWSASIGLAVGYLLHLVLDELYSIDFAGARLRHSFGSALKIIDTRRLASSILLLFGCGVLWFFLPPWPQGLTLSAWRLS